MIEDMNLNDLNELYKMYLNDAKKYENLGDEIRANKSLKDAENIRVSYSYKYWALFRENDIVNKDKLEYGKLSSLNKYLLSKGLKRCGHCSMIKSVDQFGLNKHMEDGYQTSCSNCRNKQSWINHEKKRIKKDPLSRFKIGDYIEESMLIGVKGYSTIRGLNQGLSKKKRKVCNKCGILKPFKDFNFISSNSKSRKSVCKDCETKGLDESAIISNNENLQQSSFSSKSSFEIFFDQNCVSREDRIVSSDINKNEMYEIYKKWHRDTYLNSHYTGRKEVIEILNRLCKGNTVRYDGCTFYTDFTLNKDIIDKYEYVLLERNKTEKSFLEGTTDIINSGTSTESSEIAMTGVQQESQKVISKVYDGERKPWDCPYCGKVISPYCDEHICEAKNSYNNELSINKPEVSEGKINIEYSKELQRAGIEKALREGTKTGRPFGRPKINKPENYDEIMKKWVSGDLTSRDAMDLLGLKRNTFHNMARENGYYKEV